MCASGCNGQEGALSAFFRANYMDSTCYTLHVARLVDANFAATRGHRHDLDIAGQGAHAAEGLKAMAAEGSATGFDTRLHGRENTGITCRHDVKLTADIRVLRKC